uniref:Uncharacterized protein n=1 Tax=Physcomitrium patens TaxID=3218 RepID=A0A2K1JME1_PHYPA|nr:hypothetical protein PHYPA_017550 [Physcomitrium patens]
MRLAMLIMPLLRFQLERRVLQRWTPVVATTTTTTGLPVAMESSRISSQTFRRRGGYKCFLGSVVLLFLARRRRTTDRSSPIPPSRIHRFEEGRMFSRVGEHVG